MASIHHVISLRQKVVQQFLDVPCSLAHQGFPRTSLRCFSKQAASLRFPDSDAFSPPVLPCQSELLRFSRLCSSTLGTRCTSAASLCNIQSEGRRYFAAPMLSATAQTLQQHDRNADIISKLQRPSQRGINVEEAKRLANMHEWPVCRFSLLLSSASRNNTTSQVLCRCCGMIQVEGDMIATRQRGCWLMHLPVPQWVVPACPRTAHLA